MGHGVGSIMGLLLHDDYGPNSSTGSYTKPQTLVASVLTQRVVLGEALFKGLEDFDFPDAPQLGQSLN